MINTRLLGLTRPWIERQLGFPLPGPGAGARPVVRPGPTRPGAHPLYAVRVDSVVAASARLEFVRPLQEVIEDLHPDLMFSVLGMYELSRVTLPGGVAVWGPIPNYVADKATWRPAADERPARMSEAQVAAVDWQMFWHCDSKPIGAFGVYEAGKLAAMATVADHGDSIWEIGVDVVPDAKSRGLGRAVVSAAGNWILENGKVIHATAGLWNVPSSRTLRSLGMEYVYGVMIGRPAPFKVPPQPLGQPLPGAEVQDQYPRWAMNRDITPRPDS